VPERRYTERGIKHIDVYMSERWRIEPEYAIEDRPLARDPRRPPRAHDVVTKAWEQVVAVSQRAADRVVTGAGPIGLLTALLGTQRGLEVHVLDRVGSGPKPEFVRALGAAYPHGVGR
jgi:NADPH-dependent 2,4-dienoyl-CoA reductase/sulfur reductase-like enzyme